MWISHPKPAMDELRRQLGSVPISDERARDERKSAKGQGHHGPNERHQERTDSGEKSQRAQLRRPAR